jgi:hypothetical protein
MSYYLALFSPETAEAFGKSDRTVSGFRARHRKIASRVLPGDQLLCYVTKLSRWIGALEVIEGPYEDSTPVFFADADPFSVRFKVRPTIWLPVDKAVPIFEDHVWNRLSFTRDQQRGSPGWTARIRGSLARMSEDDGRALVETLKAQVNGGKVYPIDPDEYARLLGHRVRRLDKDVSVSVPVDRTESDTGEPVPELRESVRIQALLCEVGGRMGMEIWVPRADRNSVLSEWRGDHAPILQRLPLNYDDTTLRTIEQIDVLWLRGRAIVRAFEVEHTTSIYSGILRMADLLALQPNMDIRLHLVAPQSRRDKVFQELKRPVFSLLERGPLAEVCTYLSYESVRELASQPLLAHLANSVLTEYEEPADDD